MADLWCQGIVVDDENDADPNKIQDELPQSINGYNWK